MTTDQASREGLLPCPFCGGGAGIYEEEEYTSIACNNYDCFFEGGVILKEKNTAIAAWNTRAALTHANTEMEKMREERDNLLLCLEKWHSGFYTTTKHILECPIGLTDEQFNRLKEQCEDNFGKGMCLLLEGGVKYAGTTDIRPLPPTPQAGACEDEGCDHYGTPHGHPTPATSKE